MFQEKILGFIREHSQQIPSVLLSNLILALRSHDDAPSRDLLQTLPRDQVITDVKRRLSSDSIMMVVPPPSKIQKTSLSPSKSPPAHLGNGVGNDSMKADNDNVDKTAIKGYNVDMETNDNGNDDSKIASTDDKVDKVLSADAIMEVFTTVNLSHRESVLEFITSKLTPLLQAEKRCSRDTQALLHELNSRLPAHFYQNFISTILLCNSPGVISCFTRILAQNPPLAFLNIITNLNFWTDGMVPMILSILNKPMSYAAEEFEDVAQFVLNFAPSESSKSCTVIAKLLKLSSSEQMIVICERFCEKNTSFLVKNLVSTLNSLRGK